MNSLDGVLNNRVVSAAVIDKGCQRLLLVLDGGELLEVTVDDNDPQMTWRYSTNPHPRELLGLGAPTRPRGGHGRPLDDQAVLEAMARWQEDEPEPFMKLSERWSASVAPRADPLAAPDNAEHRQVRITGHSSELVPDGIYERVGD
jgi:hypothetical protein